MVSDSWSEGVNVIYVDEVDGWPDLRSGCSCVSKHVDYYSLVDSSRRCG